MNKCLHRRWIFRICVIFAVGILMALIGVAWKSCIVPKSYGLLLTSSQSITVEHIDHDAERFPTPNLPLVLQSRFGSFEIKVCTPIQNDASNHWEKKTSLVGKRVEVIINIEKHGALLKGHMLRLNPYEVFLNIGGKRVYPSIVKGWQIDLNKGIVEELVLRTGKSIEITDWNVHYGCVLRFEATYPELEGGWLCIDHVSVDDESVTVSPIIARYGSYPYYYDSPSIKGELIPSFAR